MIFYPFAGSKILAQEREIKKLNADIKSLTYEIERLHQEGFISDMPLDCSDTSKHDCNL